MEPIQGGHKSAQEDAMFHGGISFPDDMQYIEEMNALPIENHEKETYSFKNPSYDPKFDDFMLEDFSFDSLLQQPQALEETMKVNNQGVASSESVKYSNNRVPRASSILASLELLNNYKSRVMRMKGQKISNTTKIDCSVGLQKLSTEEIIRVAGERYVQFSAYWDGNICMPMHPYESSLGRLSEEENRDVELAQFLLAAAERVGCEQYERANKILLHCESNSSACATPVQKIIYYFTQALLERIHRGIGIVTTLDGCKTERHDYSLPFVFMRFRKIPFSQVMQIAGVQAITEHLPSDTKIHIIDLEIRCGVQWTALMQALAERREEPLRLLKITAIGFRGRKQEPHFEINDDEAVPVYAPYVLSTMIPRPECLENLMSMLMKKKPRIMIVIETEASNNSPFFIKRFVEALFFFSACMDCVEICVEDDRECRMALDAMLCERIWSVVAKEGEERTRRHVKVDVWRRFFARYRIVEKNFSESSLYQTNLVVKKFAYGDFCTLGENGKSLTAGWKGTPIHSVSARKFL